MPSETYRANPLPALPRRLLPHGSYLHAQSPKAPSAGARSLPPTYAAAEGSSWPSTARVRPTHAI
jgi:hypothetical protein